MMFAPKKILWPTDFSEPALEALGVGVELATRYDATLYGLHVAPVVPMMATMPEVGLNPTMSSSVFDVGGYNKKAREDAKGRLHEIFEKHTPREIRTEPLVVGGKPEKEIPEVAEREGIDLIVIATHGIEGWRKWIFGSVTEKVVRHADCHILTVPEPKS